MPNALQIDIETAATGVRSPLGRSPDSAHVGKARLAVSNLAASKQFYRDIVGLHELPLGTDTQLERVIRLGTRDGKVLIELEQIAGAPLTSMQKKLGLYHTALLLPSRSDLGSFTAYLDERRIRYGSSDHLVSEAVYLVDPDGLTLEVYADRPRKEWKYADGMLVSGVFPLNKAALASTVTKRWNGVPQGTTMGHIHFYVSNLERSSQFYHRAMGLDIVMQVPGALFASVGGYHHQVGYNVFAAGSPVASDSDPRVLFWELLLPDAASVSATAGRLRQVASSYDERDLTAPSFVDFDGIRVVLRSELQ